MGGGGVITPPPALYRWQRSPIDYTRVARSVVDRSVYHANCTGRSRCQLIEWTSGSISSICCSKPKHRNRPLCGMFFPQSTSIFIMCRRLLLGYWVCWKWHIDSFHGLYTVVLLFRYFWHTFCLKYREMFITLHYNFLLLQRLGALESDLNLRLFLSPFLFLFFCHKFAWADCYYFFHAWCTFQNIHVGHNCWARMVRRFST